MKALIIFTLILSNVAFAAKAKRKVSSSTYFICQIEREGSDKMFKKEYHFPFPTEKGEVYELKGSMRWNNFNISFSHDGAVKIAIEENIKGTRITKVKEHQMGKDPASDSFKVQVDLKKDDVVVPYNVQCSPE